MQWQFLRGSTAAVEEVRRGGEPSGGRLRPTCAVCRTSGTSTTRQARRHQWSALRRPGGPWETTCGGSARTAQRGCGRCGTGTPGATKSCRCTSKVRGRHCGSSCAGSGAFTGDGYRSTGSMAAGLGGECNLQQPGIVRRLLDEALRRGAVPTGRDQRMAAPRSAGRSPTGVRDCRPRYPSRPRARRGSSLPGRRACPGRDEVRI